MAPGLANGLLAALLVVGCDGLRLVCANARVKAAVVRAQALSMTESALDPNSPQYREKMAAEKATIQQAREYEEAGVKLGIVSIPKDKSPEIVEEIAEILA